MDNILTFPSYSKIVWALGITFAILLFSLYIVQVNLLTQSAYLISDLETQSKHLSTRNQMLATEYMQNMPRRNLDELAEQLQFEKITTVSYIKVIDSAVAQNSQE